MSTSVLNSPPQPSRLWQALALSLALHVALVWAPQSKVAPPTAYAPIEIAELPSDFPVPPPVAEEPRPAVPTPPKSRAKELVKTEDTGDNTPDPNAEFLGERNQRAQEQMRARRKGEFQAGGEKTGAESGGATAEQKASGEPNATEVADPYGILAAPTKGEKKPWNKLSLTDLGMGGKGLSTGTNEDFLRDVAEGSRTVLSTREVKFFSYHYRVKELIQRHWRPSVQRKLAYVWGAGKTIRQDELVTKVVALLDEGGRLQTVRRVASCGFQEVDMAAVEAFQAAGPFPNPPKAMVDEDGLVRLNWDFIVTLETGPIIQFNNPGVIPPPGGSVPRAP